MARKDYKGGGKNYLSPDAIVIDLSKQMTIKDWVIHPSELEVGERLGVGSYGEVRRGRWRGTDVAVKTFHAELNEKGLREFELEVTTLASLRHPNVLQFLGAVIDGSRLSIVTELMPKGTLFSLLHSHTKIELPPHLRLRIALDVAKGMNQLHSINPPIVHRDLKSPNLLVGVQWVVKVADVSL